MQLIACGQRITELLLYVKKNFSQRACAIRNTLLYWFTVRENGWLAQLVERLPYKQDVISSSLVLPTFNIMMPSASE